MPKLILQPEDRTAYCFTEDLGNGIELDMVQIPGGQFLMGSPDDELERRSSEGPQHNVTVPDFFIGKYPVTQAQWQVVAGWDEVDRTLTSNPSNFKGADRPVEDVSWLDAIEFCKRLSAKTQRPYRLPSEAEWEYACRAGTDTPFYFGETLTPELANYDWDYIYGDYGVEKKKNDDRGTTSVGKFPANGYGLHDMHGNVWEWCADDWHSDYMNAPIDGSVWNASNDSGSRSVKVLRGGSLIDIPGWCRSAIRFINHADSASYHDGFRLVCAPPGLA
jgi:formylglycine-generating enzyme required for sulfatase activity